MGLHKRIDVDGTYWRVTELHMDWVNLTASTTLAVYVDEDARRRGDDALATRSYAIDLVAVLSTPIEISSLMDVGSVVYGIIKLHPDFQESDDVIEPDQTTVDVSPDGFQDLPIWNTPSTEDAMPA